MTNSERMGSVLTEHDPTTMLILSDALKEEGDHDTAEALIWAAEYGKFPFKLRGWTNKQMFPLGEVVEVWDWEGEHRERITLEQVPLRSRIPKKWYDIMRMIEGRHYGDVLQAFRLLGQAMKISERRDAATAKLEAETDTE